VASPRPFSLLANESEVILTTLLVVLWIASLYRARNDGGKVGCRRKKKTTKRGKSFAKYKKDSAKRLLFSANLCFDGEKTPFFHQKKGVF